MGSKITDGTVREISNSSGSFIVRFEVESHYEEGTCCKCHRSRQNVHVWILTSFLAAWADTGEKVTDGEIVRKLRKAIQDEQKEPICASCIEEKIQNILKA